MDTLSQATLCAGRGLLDNADQGGSRQITIIAQERWDQTEVVFSRTVDPIVRRANILVSGINLANSRNRILNVGPCQVYLLGETRPCERMDEALKGLQDALDLRWGGGAYGKVLIGGEINIGDKVFWE
tara:strand:- start:1569 stop:1952 length:384 start_codon:yes stop_codon:yes gene_type:complete